MRYRIKHCPCSCDRWGVWSDACPFRVIGTTTTFGTPIFTQPLRWFQTWREAMNAADMDIIERLTA